jgi:hypothetical protein
VHLCRKEGQKKVSNNNDESIVCSCGPLSFHETYAAAAAAAANKITTHYQFVLLGFGRLTVASLSLSSFFATNCL